MIKAIKILAVGTNKRFVWLDIEGNTKCIRISNEMYKTLKAKGVPTCQKLKNDKKRANTKL